MRSFMQLRFRRGAGIHIYRHMHAAGAGVNDTTLNFNQMPDVHRFIKSDAAYIHRNAVAAAPIRRAGKARLINPFHDHAAVHFAAEIDVGRLGEKSKG